MTRVFDLLLDIAGAVAAMIMFLLIIAISADVFLRTFGISSMTWVLEACEHALLAILCLGLPWLAREKGHVSVDIVVEFLPPYLRAMLARVMALAVAAILAWLTGWAVKLTLEMFASGTKTSGLYPIPRWSIFAMTSIAFGLTSIEYLRQGLGFGRQNPKRDIPL